MRKAPPLSGPGAACCLLGCTLTLVAYFLPYYGAPPASLWDMLFHLLQGDLRGPFELLSLLLPLLLSIAGLGCWAVFFRPPRWDLVAWYLHLTILTLICASIAALWTLGLDYVSAALANPPQWLYLGGIGTWFLPGGLLMAFLGGIFGEPKARNS